MINILKFKIKTDSGETGQETYARYFKNASPFVAKSGTKLIWQERVHTSLIGNIANQPHVIFLVEYPSVDHFFAMVSNPEYQKIITDRDLALEYRELIACKTSEQYGVY